MDGRTVVVILDEVITPQTCKSVRGEGMPYLAANDPMRHLKTVHELPKGDLYVRFDIQFP